MVACINEPLALEPMRDAVVDFIGEHDFTSFRNSRGADRNPIRKILRFEVNPGGFDLPGETGEMEKYTFEVEGESFLSGMVRIMIGTLIRIGSGKYPSSIIPELLEKRDPACASPPAPPEGLYLVRVNYPDDSTMH